MDARTSVVARVIYRREKENACYTDIYVYIQYISITYTCTYNMHTHMHSRHVNRSTRVPASRTYLAVGCRRDERRFFARIVQNGRRNAGQFSSRSRRELKTRLSSIDTRALKRATHWPLSYRRAISRSPIGSGRGRVHSRSASSEYSAAVSRESARVSRCS